MYADYNKYGRVSITYYCNNATLGKPQKKILLLMAGPLRGGGKGPAILELFFDFVAI